MSATLVTFYCILFRVSTETICIIHNPYFFYYLLSVELDASSTTPLLLTSELLQIKFILTTYSSFRTDALEHCDEVLIDTFVVVCDVLVLVNVDVDVVRVRNEEEDDVRSLRIDGVWFFS